MEILDFGAPKPPITDEEVAVLVAHIQTTLNDPEYVVVPEEDGFNFAECVDVNLLPVELTEEELYVLNEARGSLYMKIKSN